MSSQDKFVDALTENGWEIEVSYIAAVWEEMRSYRYRELLPKNVMIEPTHTPGSMWASAKFDLVLIKGKISRFTTYGNEIRSITQHVKAAFYEYNGGLASYDYEKPVLHELITKIESYGKHFAEPTVESVQRGIESAQESVEGAQLEVVKAQSEKERRIQEVCAEFGCDAEYLERMKLALGRIEQAAGYVRAKTSTLEEEERVLGNRQKVLESMTALASQV